MPGMVNVYDSLYNDVISQEIEEQVNDFLGARLISLDYVPVQHQINGSDCGVFLLLLLHVLLLLLIPAMLLLMFQRCVHTYKIVYNVAKYPCFQLSITFNYRSQRSISRTII